jgi:hypothetical protein
MADATDKMQVTVTNPGYQQRGELPKLIAELSSDDTWEASKFFSANAFPSLTHPFVRAAADQLALLRYACDLIATEVAADHGPFLASMKLLNVDPLRQFSTKIVFRNMAYHAGLSSALLSLKSGLDVYAKIISLMIKPDRKPALDGFNRTTVDGKVIRGGHSLTWLRKQPDFPGKAGLCTAVEEAIHGWMDEAIKYRDDAVHFGIIKGAAGSSLILTMPVAQITPAHVEPPRMPNGVPVHLYCKEVLSRLEEFLRVTLPLLPGINVKSLSLGSVEQPPPR